MKCDHRSRRAVLWSLGQEERAVRIAVAGCVWSLRSIWARQVHLGRTRPEVLTHFLGIMRRGAPRLTRAAGISSATLERIELRPQPHRMGRDRASPEGPPHPNPCTTTALARLRAETGPVADERAQRWPRLYCRRTI
jgi:hypothetical protein